MEKKTFIEKMDEIYSKRITTLSKADFFKIASKEAYKMSVDEKTGEVCEQLKLALAVFTVGLAKQIFPEPEKDDKEGSEEYE